jgi:hypothetical protein
VATLTARPDAALGPDALRGHGLSKREIRELADKLQPSDVPDFTLDLGRMRAAEDVAREMQAAVPTLDLD